MAFEMICGSCDGRLLAEQPGSVVECPHCGTHLTVPTSGLQATPEPAASLSWISAAEQLAEASTSSSAIIGRPQSRNDGNSGRKESVRRDDTYESGDDGNDEVPDFSKFETDEADSAAPVRENLSTFPYADPESSRPETPSDLTCDACQPEATLRDEPMAGDDAQEWSSDEETLRISGEEVELPAIRHSEMQFTAGPGDAMAAAADGAGVGSDLEQASTGAESAPRSTRPDAAAGASQRILLVMLASYASAITIGLVYVLLFGPKPQSNQLESLPDIQPLPGQKFQIIPVEAELPPGHTLELGGEGERFGNVFVKPLRVTRGPVEFQYFQAGATEVTREPTRPVLKLWLEFRNVSSNQVFSPLDLRLLSWEFTRDSDMRRFSNQFVRPVDTDREHPNLVFTMTHSPDDPWDIVGQNVGTVLKPDETCVMFIPTEAENLETLNGDLIWRVQFRKGFHPETLHGVTTLIDVRFDSEQIESEV